MSRDLIAKGLPGELWQGDAESALGEHHRFGVLVLCAEEMQPERRIFSPDTRVIYAPNDDSGRRDINREELRIAQGAALQVAAALRTGQRCLVTCMAGWNRSGLVSALTLHVLTGCGGRVARRIVRSRREGALSNQSFSRTLDRVPPFVVGGTILPLLVALPFVPP